LSSTTQAPPPSPEDIRAQIRAQIRDDLIRRLFAVAISVGAATTLAKMEWVQLGRWPCLPEWQQLWIIIAAMTATVLSWDGYLFSIKDRPLRNFGRFAIECMSSEHFGQFAWQFERMSGSSGLKVQAAIAC
jgi:hypothetical protein